MSSSLRTSGRSDSDLQSNFDARDATATSFKISKEKSKTHSNKSQIDTHGAAASTSKKTGINSITGQMSNVKITASTNKGKILLFYYLHS
ncbi:unnamed protein product [Rotaria magnacalcarata]